MELVAAISIFAWVVAAGLLGALLWRRPSRGSHMHPWPQAADLLGKPLPSVAPEIGLKPELVRGLLFLESDDSKSDILMSEIASAPPEGLVAVGGKTISGDGQLLQILDGGTAGRLREALAIDATPYLWVLRDGQLRAGGLVTQRSEVEALISLTGQAE